MSYAKTASTGAETTRVDSSAPLKRVLFFKIMATPPAMDSLGGDAGTFTLSPEQAVKIFARSPNMHPDMALNEIKNVMLRRARILEYRTNAPDVCSLHIEGLPGNEFTQSGEDHHLFILGKGHSQTPHDVFTAAGDVELGMQWMQEYPQYNKDNIRCKDVMRLQGTDYYFVHENHPIINLLYNNQEKLGTKIDPADRVNGNYYRINVQTFDDSCHSLDTQVFDRTPPVFDLTKFRMKWCRPDRRWVDTPQLHDKMLDIHDKIAKKEAFTKFLQKPIYVCGRMEMEYIPTITSADAPAPLPP